MARGEPPPRGAGYRRTVHSGKEKREALRQQKKQRQEMKVQNGDGDDDELENTAAPEEEDQLEPVVCDEPTALAEQVAQEGTVEQVLHPCLLYTSPSPRDS